MKINKLKALIATYKDYASSDAEKDSAYELGCRMIEKVTGCKRWVSANIFWGFVEGEVFFNSYKAEMIKEPKAVEIICDALTKIGVSYRVEEIKAIKKSSWMKKIIF